MDANGRRRSAGAMLRACMLPVEQQKTTRLLQSLAPTRSESHVATQMHQFLEAWLNSIAPRTVSGVARIDLMHAGRVISSVMSQNKAKHDIGQPSSQVTQGDYSNHSSSHILRVQRVVGQQCNWDRGGDDPTPRCCIGILVDPSWNFNSLEHSTVKRCVWARGSLHAEIVPPASKITNWHLLPDIVSDEVALLADDMAAAISIAKSIVSTEMNSVIIVAGMAGYSTAALLVSYLKENRRLPPTIKFFVVVTDSPPTQPAWGRLVDVASTMQSEQALDHDFGTIDLCVDLTCTGQSLRFATSRVVPMGTIILLNRNPINGSTGPVTVALDTNAVVVNELTLIHLGDYSTEVSHAIDYLAAQCASDHDSVRDAHSLLFEFRH